MEVQVQVPEARLAEFYKWFGAWLAGDSLQGSGASVIGLKEWTEDDIEDARTLWNKFSPPARDLFGVLMEAPETKMSGGDLAARAGIENGRYGVAGTLAWPGRHASSLGRGLPVRWSGDTDGASVYWMTEPVARLFRAARSSQA